MQVHYVDDDEVDAQLMIRKAGAHKNFEITTTSALAKNNKSLLPVEIDCVVIDINRPDAESIESDVAHIRDRSDVPIIFVTGGVADDFRPRAHRAGAEAVIDKNSLSVELVQQLAINARTRAPVLDPIGKSKVARDGLAYGYNRVLLLDYLDVCLWRKNRDRHDIDIRRCIRALQIMSGSDNHDVDVVKLSGRLRAVRSELMAMADLRMVNLQLEINSDDFAAIGPAHCVEMGLICMIGGLIRSATSGSTVSCKVYDHHGGPAISYSSSGEISVKLEDLFQKRKPHYSSALGTNLAICTGIALLGLRHDQIRLISTGSMQKILMH